MNREPYAISLNSALTEIKKTYPGIHHSFLFTNTGLIVAKDLETNEEVIQNIFESFDDLKEKTKTIGNINNFSVTGKNGKLFLSNVDDMYLVLATSKSVDESQINSITKIIIPTILKTVETLVSTHLQSKPEKKLIVDTISGFFAGDSVQIDKETLIDWTNTLDSDEIKKTKVTKEETSDSIDQVKIETFAGNSVLCKVKEITDPKLKVKNLIRIPEKICKSLVVKKGDQVLVKPML